MRHMRTSQQLRWIGVAVDNMREARGDTIWSDEDRRKIDQVQELLASIGPAADEKQGRG